MMIPETATVVFAGDSITHWYGSHEALGLGYCGMAGRALERVPKGTQVRAHNRGISGNRIADLLARLDDDVLSLEPDWVSLLIGVNDTEGQGPGTPNADFERDYRAVVEQIRGLTDNLIIMTPFYFPGPGRGNKNEADLAAKIAIVSAIAQTHARVFIPLHERFDALRGVLAPELLAKDGVHPTMMGAGYIADCWWQALGAQEL